MFRVLWRFRLLVGVGLCVAIALALLSYTRIEISGAPKISYRDSEGWESEATFFVNSRRSPIGSTASDGTDDGRLRELTALYLEIARSDAVYKLMLSQGPIHGQLQPMPVFIDGDSNLGSLPMITLAAVAAHPDDARALATRYVNAFRSYILRQQEADATPPESRVQLDLVRKPTKAVLVQPRKRTRPIIVFMTTLIAVIGLAFVLENMRPRMRTISSETIGPVAASPKARQSA